MAFAISLRCNDLRIFPKLVSRLLESSFTHIVLGKAKEVVEKGHFLPQFANPTP